MSNAKTERGDRSRLIALMLNGARVKQFFGRRDAEAREQLLDALPGSGRPRKHRPELKPVSAYEKDQSTAAPFYRKTGETISPPELMSYADALGRYHHSAESKFENGRPLDEGRTQRRHVNARGARLIGKEANKVGEFGETYPGSAPCLEFNALRPRRQPTLRSR